MTGTEGELEALLGFLYAAPVGLVRTDEDGAIQMVNGAAMRLLLPVAAEPARLANLFDALAAVAPDLRRVVQASGGARGPLVQERRLCLQGAGERPETALHAALTLHRLDERGLIAVLSDITATVRGEQLLRAGEARLRFLLDAAVIGDWHLDLDTGHLLVQGPFARCLGQPETAAPWTLDRLMRALHDDDRDAAYAAFDHALLTGEDWRVEARLVPDGAADRWLMLQGRMPDGIGGGRVMLGMVQDVTARRQAESARMELLRMEDEKRLVERSARMRTQFLARMSHEFRTPLNAILGMAQLLRRRLLNAADRQAVERIERAGAHLAGMVGDVLDLAKVDAGEFTLRPAPFELDEVLASALEMVSGQAHDKGIGLVLDAGALPPSLVGDAGRLRQALVNLLSNAVRLTERGHVALRVRCIDSGATATRLRFEVEDTGPGISEAAQAALFQPYAQLSGGNPGGAGLGLAITRQIARQMGGDAGLHSRVGEGSRFWFTASFGMPSQPAEQPDVVIAGRSAVLVDPLPVSREALSAQLRALGLRVEAVASASDVVAAVQGPVPDTVMLSTRAGAADVIRSLDALRARLRETMPPVVLLGGGVDGAGIPPERVVDGPATFSALRAALHAALPAPGAPAPVRASVPEPTSAEERLRSRHAGRRVLVVEDDPISREVALELLRGAGLDVDLAHDGAQGVAMAQARSYGLVLMDVRMPVMDGIAATRALRASLGPELPIVGLSANAYAQDRAACAEAGMDDHLAKPVDADVLFARVLHWLDQRPPGGRGAEVRA